MSTPESMRSVFRKLHESGCFVIPNPWDVGSARFLESLGFPALATTSSGIAWSMGHADNGVGLEEVLERLSYICTRVDVPVNADFEGGFGKRLMLPAPRRGGIVLGYALAALVRWSIAGGFSQSSSRIWPLWP